MIDIDAIRAAATERAARTLKLGDLVCTKVDDVEYWSRISAILDGKIVDTGQKLREVYAKDIDGPGSCVSSAFPDDLILSVPARLARTLAPEVKS